MPRRMPSGASFPPMSAPPADPDRIELSVMVPCLNEELNIPELADRLLHPQNRGIAAGWRSAVAVARGKLVATIDADLQYQPEDLLRLRRELYDHAVDVVQGWRSTVGRRKDRRYTLSRGLNA